MFILVRFMVNRSMSIHNVLLLVYLVNAGSFIASVLLLGRINNSYIIAFYPWLLFVISTIFESTSIGCLKTRLTFYFPKHLLAFATSSFLVLIISISLVHFYLFPWLLKKNNFKKLLHQISAAALHVGCTELPYVSGPYFAFLPSHPLDASDLIKFDFDKALSALKDKPDSCIIIGARHYYAFEYFTSFSPTAVRLREALKRDFSRVAIVGGRFYRKDPYFPHVKRNGDIEYPMGSDYSYHGGFEKLRIFKNVN